VLASPAQPEIGLNEETVTRIDFHDEGDGTTRVELTGGPYSEMLRGHAATGWSQSFDKLDVMPSPAPATTRVLVR
jgi:hypothetical protein